MKFIALLLVAFSYSAMAVTPWERYLNEPSASNASLVKAISYSVAKEGTYDSGDLEILKLQVLAADSSAYNLTFRLYNQADGGLAEELAAILAAAIRPHPKFFLQQVAMLDPSCSHFNVNVAGLEYVDRFSAQEYERRMRYSAIEAVHDSTLRTVRANCLTRLPPR